MSDTLKGRLAGVAPGQGIDRDVMFAKVEQRLLGRSLSPVTIGRFVVLRRLGHGGMGVVYEAHDPKLDRKVAVKVVDDGSHDGGTPRSQQELLREAQAAATLSHPNVVTIFEVGTEGEAVFVAMELVDGATLRKWLAPATRTWREITTMFVGAAEGLAAAHHAGLVHRDFKPDNVLIGVDGRPRVADFGLARALARDRPSDADLPTASGAVDSTRTGDSFTAIAGTPRYMAPEQYEGRGIGPACDQFALCVALYEALCGAHPFDPKGEGSESLTRRVLAGRAAAPHPRVRGVPKNVMRMVMKGLALRPADRHTDLDELIARLRSALARRQRIVVGAGALGLAAATAALGYASAPTEPIDPCQDATAPILAQWNDGTKAAVRSSLSATMRRDVETTTALVIGKIDRYAQQWAELRQQSCEATRIEGQRSDLLLELSYACLDRRLGGLTTVLAALQEADAMTLERATVAVDMLPPLPRCVDRADLLATRGAALSERSDRNQPGADRRWSELFARIRKADALRSLGRADEAMAIVAEVVEAAEAEQLRGVHAAGLALRGRLWLRDRNVDNAEADLKRAAALALEADLPDIAMQALVRLSAVERRRRDNLDHAHVYLDLAEGLGRRDGTSEVAVLGVAMERARIARLQGHYDAARDRLDEALSHAPSLLADHTTVIAARNDLAANLVSLGQLDEAHAIFTELLPLQIAAKGPWHRSVGMLRTNLGAIAHTRKRYAEAREHYERALELHEDNDDERNAEQIWFRLGLLELDENKLAAAQEKLLRVYSSRSIRRGTDHVSLAEVHSAQAEVHRLRGEYGLALREGHRAIELLEAAHGPEHLGLRIPLVSLGRTQLQGGDRREAVTALRRAHALVYAHDIDGAVRAEVQFDLAKALIGDPTQKQEAIGHAEEASRLYALGGERSAEQKAEVDAWLASDAPRAPI